MTKNDNICHKIEIYHNIVNVLNSGGLKDLWQYGRYISKFHLFEI